MNLLSTASGCINSAGGFPASFTPAGAQLPSVLAPVVLLAFLLSGCVAPPTEPGAIVSHGNISSAFPRVRTMVIDIDRRTYMGTTEPTAPNQTFGFNRLYGPGRYAAGPAATPDQDIHYKAILSSTDHHVLRCDLTHNDGRRSDGLCLDDFGQIYDVVSSR
jgi:hypothetical protein